MHPARLWKSLGNNVVQCRLCSQFCRIEPDEVGFCGVRQNVSGELFTLVADRVAAANVDPVEKKPLYHFLPGSKTFSFGTVGCNLSCSFCQNYSLSDSPRSARKVGGHKVTPQALVEEALQIGAKSISYTYNEPTIFFELLVPTAKLAIEHGLRNIIVSNGFQSQECLQELDGLIHAANIDLKAFTPEFYEDICGSRLRPVLENIKTIYQMGWWLELTTLLIPGANDSDAEIENMARFIADELSPDVPWHVSRFHPTFNMTDRPSTPIERLERAWEIGREAGVHYVYLGNVHGHPSEHTCCPSCSRPVLQRIGYRTEITGDGAGVVACDACGVSVAGVWS